MDECLRLIPVKVSAIEQDSLNKGLSIEEIDAAIDSLSNGKSPGIDGLLAEFYKKILFLDKCKDFKSIRGGIF